MRGDEVWVDFEGTAPQVAAGLNCPVGMVNAGVYCAFRGIAGREIPNAGGYMRPIHINAPEGTIVNPVLPAACGARGVVGYRVYDAVMGALAQVVPDKVIAPGEGGPTLIAIGGYEDGKPFVLTEVIVGCWGARAGRDGLEGVSNPLANLSNQPVELVESELPLRVHGYGLVADSGGPGRFRGGLAYERSFELLADEAVLTVRSDRRAHPPYGIDGGEAGAPSSNTIGDRVVPTMPMEALKLRRGDVFRHVSAGGGGSGSPLERDPALVLEDVLDGKVSVEAARERYGVVDRGRQGVTPVSFDVVIRGGTVYDGTGAAGRVADVGVKDGRIAAIGSLEATGATIDAAGLAVTPGFIDIHSHSDYTLLHGSACGQRDPPGRHDRGRRQLRLRLLPDPRSAAGAPRDLRLLRRPPDHAGARRASTSRRSRPRGRRSTCSASSRTASCGWRRSGWPTGRPTPAELAEMQGLLRESLDDGAWGYSTGLEYAQEQAASEDELTALARRRPFYATHTRKRDDGAADAVAEAIRTGANAEVRLQVSHLVPRNGIEESRRCIELVEPARDAGQDVAFDMHTRTFGLTNLYAALPAWALGAEPAELAAILRDPAKRDEMRGHRSILSAGNDWSRVVLLDNEIWPEYSAPRPRVDRRRPRPRAARRRLRPPARAASTSCTS